MSYRDETIIDGRLLDTPNQRGDGHKYYSSSGSGAKTSPN